VLRIPRAPAALDLVIERSWDGAPGGDPRLRGIARLQATDLWEYDVVECFLVGRDGRYLELELGAGGHFLALCFDAPRRCCDALEEFLPELAHRADERGWSARMLAPWRIVPAEIVALNAFVAAGGRLLAHAPLPGERPDFHQPARFPAARLDPEAP
jgi:hypothetical protein